MIYNQYMKKLKKNEAKVDREKFDEVYPKIKIYNNGEHDIGIPHITRRLKRRPKKKEQEFIVREVDGVIIASKKPTLEEINDDEEEFLDCPFDNEIAEHWQNTVFNSPKNELNADMVPSNEGVIVKKPKRKKVKNVTRASEFARLYPETKQMRRAQKINYIVKYLRPFFQNAEATKQYVEKKVDDKYRAANTRCERFRRKADNFKFDYFATFTYDSSKMTEEEFEKKLPETLRHFVTRRDWRYMGVWERGGEKGRLHFHCILKVPQGQMVGEFETIKNYNFKHHDTRKVCQNTFFRETYGLNEFSRLLPHKVEYSRSVNYILKYVTKYDAKVVSSRGLPLYFETNITGDDAVCKTGVGFRKLVLNPETKCYNEDGEYIGTLNDEETKKRLKHLSS